jgi:FkbM family methyltransferase
LNYKNSWRRIPSEIIENGLAALSIKDLGFKSFNNEKVPFALLNNGLIMLGPQPGIDFNCSPHQISEIKRLFKPSRRISIEPAIEHYALIHNLIHRYQTEFASFPYWPYRTKNLIAGDLFVDIGAFRGYVSQKACKVVGIHGKVFTFEPIPNNVALIKEAVRLNRFENITVFDESVSTQQEETISFYMGEGQRNSEIINHLNEDVTKKTTVKNCSVIKLCNRIKESNLKRVIVSLTTNGTEITIAKEVFELLHQSSLEYCEINIPIIFTEEEVLKQIPTFEDMGLLVEMQYPWAKLIKKANH